MVGRRRRRFVTKRRFFFNAPFDFLPISFPAQVSLAHCSLSSLYIIESETLYFSKGACDEAMIFYGPHLANRRFD